MSRMFKISSLYKICFPSSFISQNPNFHVIHITYFFRLDVDIHGLFIMSIGLASEVVGSNHGWDIIFQQNSATGMSVRFPTLTEVMGGFMGVGESFTFFFSWIPIDCILLYLTKSRRLLWIKKNK